MTKNIKRVMGILLAATMSISLVMPAFASQTGNTDAATKVQEQNEQADANGSENTADDAQTTDNSSDQATDDQKESTVDSTGSSKDSDQSEADASDTGNSKDSDQSEVDASNTDTSDKDKKSDTSDNAAQAPVEGNVTQDTETKKEPVKGEIQTEVADDNVVVGKHDKPYLALGADLTAEQQATVLGLMGIDPAKLSDYDVVQVTNTMEHEYLDEYLPSSTIGSRALSSVLIMEGKKGSGIQISIKNISYCTVGMYKSALATAGIEDAEIIVAGPFPISGTAALVGALKAYSEMTGDEVKEDNLDTAMNEIVVTGKLADATGGDKAKAEEMMAYLKQEVVKNDLKDEKSINEAIERGCKEFDIQLTDAQKAELLGLLKKISDLDLDWNTLKDQASDLYDRLDELGLLSDSGIGAKLRSLLQAIIDFFKSLF